MRAIAGLAAVSAACLVFHMPVYAASERVLYAFCTARHKVQCYDGASPRAALINVGNTLYGTTDWGGTGGGGTVFLLDPITGAETVLYSFCSQSNCTDGALPSANLSDVSGLLYGTTYMGGTGGEQGGTVFSLDPATGTETVLHSFGGGKDGLEPAAGLIDFQGMLYGTTQYGGSVHPCRCGTVFSINPSTGQETVLHSFGGPDGNGPIAALKDAGNTLYGITIAGGTGSCVPNGCGTVFSVNPTTGEETTLYSFKSNGTDGNYPAGGLADVKGTLYGTTEYGGAYDSGTVFSIDPATDRETVLYSFRNNGADGMNPAAKLLRVGGILYGTTADGGDTSQCVLSHGHTCGTVFSFDPATNSETVLYSFCWSKTCRGDGRTPEASVVAINNTLYGTTMSGGYIRQRDDYCRFSGCGTVFAVRLK